MSKLMQTGTPTFVIGDTGIRGMYPQQAPLNGKVLYIDVTQTCKQSDRKFKRYHETKRAKRAIHKVRNTTGLTDGQLIIKQGLHTFVHNLIMADCLAWIGNTAEVRFLTVSIVQVLNNPRTDMQHVKLDTKTKPFVACTKSKRKISKRKASRAMSSVSVSTRLKNLEARLQKQNNDMSLGFRALGKLLGRLVPVAQSPNTRTGGYKGHNDKFNKEYFDGYYVYGDVCAPVPVNASIAKYHAYILWVMDWANAKYGVDYDVLYNRMYGFYAIEYDFNVQLANAYCVHEYGDKVDRPSMLGMLCNSGRAQGLAELCYRLYATRPVNFEIPKVITKSYDLTPVGQQTGLAQATVYNKDYKPGRKLELGKNRPSQNIERASEKTQKVMEQHKQEAQRADALSTLKDYPLPPADQLTHVSAAETELSNLPVASVAPVVEPFLQAQANGV